MPFLARLSMAFWFFVFNWSRTFPTRSPRALAAGLIVYTDSWGGDWNNTPLLVRRVLGAQQGHFPLAPIRVHGRQTPALTVYFGDQHATAVAVDALRPVEMGSESSKSQHWSALRDTYNFWPNLGAACQYGVNLFSFGTAMQGPMLALTDQLGMEPAFKIAMCLTRIFLKMLDTQSNDVLVIASNDALGDSLIQFGSPDDTLYPDAVIVPDATDTGAVQVAIRRFATLNKIHIQKEPGIGASCVLSGRLHPLA